MRTRDLTLRSAAILLVLTFGAVLVHGYHPGVEDDFVYLPAIKHNLNPALYPHDADFFQLQLQATVFDKVVAWSVKLTHAPLDWALLFWQTAAIFLVLLGCWKIARRCFSEEHAQWTGVTLIAALLTIPVAGTALYLVDQHLHPRALATAFVLFAIANVMDRRLARAAIWIVLAFTFHPIMAAFGASFCLFLAWPFAQGRGSQHPPAAQSGSQSVPLGATGRAMALLPILPAWLFPIGWIFERPSAAWREAASTRSYYFLGRQEWYEWLGTLAPLVILFWFSKLGDRTIERSNDHTIGAGAEHGSDRPIIQSCAHPVSWLSSRLIWYALFQFVVTLAIMLPPQVERFRTLQPLRYLHLVYLLMFLIGGGLLGKYVLKGKVWRWAILFVPLSAGMFWAQRQAFPASAHLEIGRAAHRNAWVQAFVWARDNTPTDAYFALGSRYYEMPGEDWHSFRAIAERGQLAEALKDPSVSTQVPRLAPRWQRESHAQDGWEHFQKSDFERLKRDFGVNWVVLDRDIAGLSCPYSERGIRVCAID